MHLLIIGGTRNMGYLLTRRLMHDGHRVTILNRGITPDDLGEQVARLRADRTDVQQMRRALLAKSFDAVVDFTLYNGREAQAISEILRGQTGHYVFISSGQVYLVREGLERPYTEADYSGRVMPAPKLNTYAYEEWHYGISKREAEDTLAEAQAAHGFPYTSLRLPMVNSERDQMRRLYSYVLRLKDGGPILVPETPDYPLKHIYAGDVVEAIVRVVTQGLGKGDAFNLSQTERVTIDEFLAILGELVGMPSRILRYRRSELEAAGFLPDASPFSDRWMSELDATRSQTELGISYTPLREYLAHIVAYYAANPPAAPVSYKRRQAELSFAERTPALPLE